MIKWLTSNRTRIVAIVVPLTLVGVCDLFVVQPRVGAGRQAAAETVAVRVRLSAMPQGLTEPSVQGASDAVVHEFERRIPASDRVPDVLERLARLALDISPPGEVRGLKIETGDRLVLTAPDAQKGPRVAGESSKLPDPRLALFATRLTYTSISVSLDATYPALGRFLWSLQGLPTTIEIRSLDVTRPADGAEDGRFLRVDLALFAFQRGA